MIDEKKLIKEIRNMNIELLKKIRELKEENRRLRYGNKN